MIRTLLLIGGTLALAGCVADAEEAKLWPDLELTGRVMDAAEIFKPNFEEALTSKLAKLEKDTKVQLVVATTPDLEGHEIEFYSLELANSWGIGSEERDDGLILLVAPNERKVRIEVGRGLEASVKDEEAKEIIRDTIIPEFENGDYEAGVEAGVEKLILEVTPHEMKEAA